MDYQTDKYRVSQEIPSQSDWDAFVGTLKDYSFLMSYAYSEFKRLRLGAKYKVSVVRRLPSKQLVGILPYAIINAKRGKLIEFRHAPIIDWGDSGFVEFILRYLKLLGKRNNVWMVRFSPYIKEETWNQIRGVLAVEMGNFKQATIHERDYERTAVLNLKGVTYKELFRRFARTHRKRIRRGKQMGFVVREYEHLSGEFNKFLDDIFYATVKRKGWTDYPRSYYTDFFRIFSKYKMVRFYTVYYKGKMIYGSLHTFYKNKALPLISGTHPDYLKLAPSYYFRGYLLERLIQEGIHTYDFGGIGPIKKGHPLYGVTTFKLGFGAKPVKYASTYDVIISPLAYLTRAYEVYESVTRGWYNVKEGIVKLLS